jgi:hypothetical protein
MRHHFVIILLFISCVCLQAQNVPFLKKQGTATQLIVEGKPFIMLSGELHNSACSTVEFMKPIWPNMKAKNLNTVISTVSWELLEPIEGQYDFTLVDAQIEGARKEGLKLVIIWFASWKNGGSTYMPSWVKRDFNRFPRTVDHTGKPIEILSTFGEESMKADAKAFRALMKHIKAVDHDRTVLMMQLENEVGVLNTVRDFHPLANKAFNGPIPKQLGDYLQKNRNNMSPELHKVWSENGFKTTGTWEEVFGKSYVNHRDWKDMSYYTEEIFMAYHYARYIGYIATEGKKEYNIPMFANAWLKGPDDTWTGRFPGGGPLWHVMDIWRCAGPDIDFLAPDIYVPHFQYIVEQYNRLGNAMFIPETMGGATGASRFLWALGEHGLMGFSPFAIDRSPATPTDPLAQTYKLIEGMMDMITAHQGKPTIRGILVDTANPEQKFELGDFIVTADLMQRRRPATETTPAPPPAASGGLIIQLGPEEYIVLGRDLNVRFTPKIPGRTPHVALDRVEEGIFTDGKWTVTRVLNGDETHCSTFSGTGLKMPGMTIQKVKLYRYN